MPDHGAMGSLKFAIQCLMLPGAAVAMVVARNVHGTSIWVIEGVNVVVYFVLLYFLLGAKRTAQLGRKPF
jgi:hypothetical protein